MIETCCETLHPDAIKGIELFNQGDYFAAHEELEEAWKHDRSTGRDLYRGVLQIAVAYFHLWKGNYKGTVKMFQRSHRWLDPLPDICRGIDVAQLREDAFAIQDEVLSLGPDQIEAFEIDKLKPIKWEQVE